jgi:excisionase family DNA binding protein
MQTNRQQRDWLALKEVANQLGVHVSAVYRAVERGQLAALRLSGTGAIRIHRSVLEPSRETRP